MSLSMKQIERVLAAHRWIGSPDCNMRCSCGHIENGNVDLRTPDLLFRLHVAAALEQRLKQQMADYELVREQNLKLRQADEQERDDFAIRCLHSMHLNLYTDGKGAYKLPRPEDILAAVKAEAAACTERSERVREEIEKEPRTEEGK